VAATTAEITVGLAADSSYTLGVLKGNQVVKNELLTQHLLAAARRVRLRGGLRWRHVKAHRGDLGNELADTAA